MDADLFRAFLYDGIDDIEDALSYFSDVAVAVADLNLAAIRDDQILATSLGDGRTLESAIIAAGDGVNLVNKMEAAVSDETASSQCDTLAATLRTCGCGA